MVKRHLQALLLATLVVALAAVALVSANAGHANGQDSSNPGLVYVGAQPAFPGTAQQVSTPAQAQPSATQEPLLTEVLTPVVSQPVPTGRGLFDEITDRLLRALLNFF
jgi:hypothetical protein